MEAASADRIDALLGRLGDGLASGSLQAASTTALIVTRMLNSRVDIDDLHRLSSVFLEDRRQCMTGVLGPHGYSMPDVDFVFLPIVESCASTFIDSDRTTIFLSLGLMEALRLAIASAQLESAIGRLEGDEAIGDALSAPGRIRALEQLRLMTQYFNASTVLHFKAPGALPGAASLLDAATKHRVDVVLEAVLMFLLLHEMGHVDFHRRADARDKAPHLVWEFAVPEDVNEAKQEEFYADAFALRAVPKAFALPLVHAATFFLHLHNYVDATATVVPSTHPLCVNRIATLYALAGGKDASEVVGHRAVARALEAGSNVLRQPNGHFSLEALRRYVGALSEVDWGPAQEALQMLALRDEEGVADARR
jgi:hypothetical protein